MKKMLFLTIILIAVPSFFILNYKDKIVVNTQVEEKKEEIKENITIRVMQTEKNKFFLPE